MKLKLLYLLFFITTISYAQIPTSGLSASYDFTNGSFIDQANGNNFTQTGSSLLLANDRFISANNAIQLNGDYLTRSDVNFGGSTNTFSITWSFWVKTTTDNTDVKTIIDDSSRNTVAGFDGDDVGYYIYLRSGNIGLSSRYYEGSFVVPTQGKGYGHLHPNYVADGNWHHIVVTFNPTLISGVQRMNSTIYVDGIANSKSSIETPIVTSPNTNGNVTIANSRTNHLSSPNIYEDELDDILAYNRVLTSNEVEQIRDIGNFCFKPNSNLISASNITQNSADVTITGNDTYDLAYHKVSEPFSSATIISNVSNGVQSLTGLDTFTEYYVYLREQCTVTTDWSDSVLFKTERPLGRIYVNANATGNNNGLDWANAYNSLQDALSDVQPTEEIWVAQGTYSPDASDRSISFTITQDDVKLYGGFNGTESNLSDRDYLVNETILSGDLQGNDDTTLEFVNTTRNDNSYNIVTVNANNFQIDGFTISDAHANGSTGTQQSGGAIFKGYTVANLNVYNCKLKNNVAIGAASAIFSRYDTSGTLKVYSCSFENNLARHGTTIYFYTSTGNTINAEVVNSLFNGNIAKDNGATKGYAGSAGWFRAIGSGSTANCLLLNNTYSGNQDLGTTTGLNNFNRATVGLTYTSGTLNADVSGCIFWGNTTSGGATTRSIAEMSQNFGQNILVDKSIDQGGFASIAPVNVTNSLSSDPLFVNASSNDFSLQSGSPAIDSGDGSKLPFTISKDVVGNPRIYNGQIDMGAVEQACSGSCYTLTINIVGEGTVSNNGNLLNSVSVFNANEVLSLEPSADFAYAFSEWTGDATGTANPLPVTMDSDKTITVNFVQAPVYVDIDATGSNNGSSWANAFTDLQSALSAVNASSSATSIWIAEGRYTPATSGRTNSFIITKENLEIYGGFNGTETDLSQRDVTTYTTILSGDLSNNDTSNAMTHPTRTDNTYNVVKLNANNVTLDGLTIRDGHANNNPNDDTNNGSGILVSDTVNGFNLKNCTISNNVSRAGGAVLAFFNSDAAVTIENCHFDSNRARYGSGLYLLVDNNRTVTLDITNSLFTNNSSEKFTNTELGYTGSSAWIRATGTQSNLTTTITNCTFAKNSDIGTEPTSQRGTLALSRRTDGNSTHNVTINNTIIYNNTGAGGSVTNDVNRGHTSLPNQVLVNNSIGELNFSLLPSGNLTNTSNSDPLFSDLANNDFTLQLGSPAINSGDNSKIPSSVTTDLSGNNRIFDTTVDMGAYESAIVPFTLTINAANGSVSTNPNPTGGVYANGTVVTLTATPDAGYQFDGWSGDATGTTNPLDITMDADKTVTALFSPIQRTLTINATNGSVSTNPNPTSGTYDNGTVVTLTATPDAGYQFDGWSGDASGTTNPLDITMDADKTVTALFSPIQRTLTINATDGSVAVAPNSGTGTYDDGSVLTLTATPDAGYEFTGWSGDASGTTNPLNITMDADKTVTANFSPIQRTLAVNATNGSVAVAPNSGTGTYDDGSVLTLTAIPDAGFEFTGWSGDASGTTNPLNITMDADKTVTANFSPIQRTLTINAINGSVTVAPNSGTGTYDDGSVLTLTAIPDAGFEFTGWSGDANGATNPLDITMDADKTVTANFSPIQRTLTVNATNGSVAVAPNSGTGTYDNGTVVTLTATPNAGYEFTGWSGDASGTTNPLDITMDADKTVTANFSPIQRALTINATNGSIAVSPNSGTGMYDDGSVLTLTATPDAGYQFDGWSGDASGTINPLDITMDADKTVTANFSPIQRTLTINAANGSVTASPNPVNGTYDNGTVVTLTATPDSGYQFDSWSGDVSGSTNQITITMDTDKTVTATFSVTLGVNEEQFKIPFKLYPNPVKDVLHIDSEEDVKKIKIYNAIGREVIIIKSFEEDTINVADLSQGIYFMIIETESGKGVRRFIKK